MTRNRKWGWAQGPLWYQMRVPPPLWSMWQNQGESRLGGSPDQGRTHREGAALGNISHEVKGLSPSNFGASSPILSHNGLGFLISYGSWAPFLTISPGTTFHFICYMKEGQITQMPWPKATIPSPFWPLSIPACPEQWWKALVLINQSQGYSNDHVNLALFYGIY